MTGVTDALASLGPDARDRLPAAPDVDHVAAPKTIDELAGVLRTASDHGLKVLVWGGGTHQGIGYGVSPDVVVVTTGLDRIVDWQPDDLTIVVEGGVTVDAIEAMLAERGQTAVLPEVPGDATVGGVVASASSGWRRLAYGPTRDRMLEAVLVTGDGRIVTGGGRVVKNVSGYDIPRLVTGSYGSLGVIGQVCLKLWPVAAHAATITVEDAAAAYRTAYRPLAIIETSRSTTVMIAGTAGEIAGQVADLGGMSVEGLHWPGPLTDDHRFSLRVPAPLVGAAVTKVRALDGSVHYRAAHGVGEVLFGLDDVPLEGLVALRAWAEACGGALVTLHSSAGVVPVFDPWGAPPVTLELQRRVKAAFDPAGIMNPGRLPGRL